MKMRETSGLQIQKVVKVSKMLRIKILMGNCRGDNSCKTVRLNIEQQNNRGVYSDKKMWENVK